MGMIDSHEGEENGLGFECAGIIQRVGPEVKGFAVGDRVMSFCGSSFSTLAKSYAQFCVKIPDGLSFEDAATMPCVYVTVIHSLLRLAQLEKGEVSFPTLDVLEFISNLL
jgi:NADPH:quinone reductase-like Zn-dependent oxidoreductase